MREALIEAMKVLKVYDVATTSTLTIVTQTKGFGGAMARNLKGIHVTNSFFKHTNLNLKFIARIFFRKEKKGQHMHVLLRRMGF